MLDEEPLVAEEALLEPLRIVEPVNADDHRSPVGAADHPLVRLAGRVALRQRAEFGRVDPDRADDHPHAAPADMERVALDPRIHLEHGEIAEGLQPFVGVETDYVVSRHGPDEFLRLGQRGKQPARRPRRVEEESHAVVDTALAQLRAERDHVIVLHPHGVVGLDQRLHGVGEPLVGAAVSVGEIALELGEVDPVVEQRPQRAVGVAVVVFLDVLLLEIDRGCRDPVGPGERDLAGELVGQLARPPEPDPAHLAQGGRQGH